MGEIYSWFRSFFGLDLAEHLWGWDMVAGDYTKANQFNSIGLYMILLTFFMVILFYYIINHPRFNKWWSWLIVLAINLVLNFTYAWRITLSDLNNNVISDDLVYVRDPDTSQIISQKIVESNCINFGITNAIIATILFILFSFMFRWWSRNCSTCPYPN